MRPVSRQRPVRSGPLDPLSSNAARAKKQLPRLGSNVLPGSSFHGVNRKGPKVAKIKAHSLTGRITEALMHHAFRNVRRNRGAAGIDKVSITMFEANLEQNLRALMRDLKTGTFQPLPLRRVHIPKGQGQTRPLGIPAVRDRVAQEVLRQLLSPLFERLFHDDSFGFRPGRNCHMAVERVLDLHRQGHTFVLDADIKGFFDNIPHSVIMAGVAAEVADGNILRLVERFLKAGVMEEGVFRPTVVGTPQGGVISPLLANIALNSLDWHLHEHGQRFVRYADDFVVLCRDEAGAQEAIALVQEHLSTLGLTLSAEKTKQTKFREGFAFLGFWISSWSVTMRAKSIERLKTKVRELTPRHHNLDGEVIVRLNRVIRGTANYFATWYSEVGDLFRSLDRWIRMRLRCMKYKRKRRTDNGRFRLRYFRKMGLLFLSDLRVRPA
jgi:group II intron reverse transcriptase/maturase